MTQTNVPMLGPEILAVFANSQIFQDHQPTKLNRISTKTYLAGIHSPNREMPTTPRMSEQERLLRRLEGNDSHSHGNSHSHSHSHSNSRSHSHALIVPIGNSGKNSGKSTRSSSIVSGGGGGGSGMPKVKFYLS